MKFAELVNINELQELCENFTGITGAVTTFLDPEGNILLQSGWQDICTRYHRTHPATSLCCRESDTIKAGQLKKGESYTVYKCKNGLVNVAVPIMVDGEHVANFFTGQFFFEHPVEEPFIFQAKEFGFDKTSYIEALRKVPVFSEQQVRMMMEFFTHFARLICEMGLSRKRLEDAKIEQRCQKEHLEDLVNERTSELIIAKEEAENANRAKSVFLANISHELRTPLDAVLGFSQLMENAPNITNGQRENLNIITSSGEHLLNLIDNVLEISKIESGRMALEESPIDVIQMMQEIASLMCARAREKGLDFTLEPCLDLNRHITVDGGKLRQVLINLIGNSIKYTQSGRVIVRIMVTDKTCSERVRLRFEVDDSGPGIREEDRERIFSPFVQLEDRPYTKAGSGLGLAICKQYAELMGGTIGVAGKQGNGSVFHLEIPVTPLPYGVIPAAPRRARVIGPAEGQPRYRLLIAEDQQVNRLLLRELLEPLGFDLREAVNGEEAFALFGEWHPHLIFMDIRMPVMDGLEATRRIKSSDTGADTRIVAVTAHALEEQQCEFLAEGCDDIIRKPYRYADILDALTKNLGMLFVYEEEAASPPVAVPPNVS